MEEEEWDQVAPLSEAKCSLTAQVLNDDLYVFGGYVGEGQISHRIEKFNDALKTWTTLTVELPFALEGLASIVLDDELLIVGGKGLEGSKKQIIRYTAQELEDDNNSNGYAVFTH